MILDKGVKAMNGFNRMGFNRMGFIRKRFIGNEETVAVGRISEMSDAEYRKFKAKRMERYRFRRNLCILCCSCVLLLAGTISFHAFSSSANTEDAQVYYKYYTHYHVNAGETMETIATRYMDEHYDSMEEYLKEVYGINGYTTEHILRSGEVVVFPYYSTEYKA